MTPELKLWLHIEFYLFFYMCDYPHTSKDSVSPVCRILVYITIYMGYYFSYWYYYTFVLFYLLYCSIFFRNNVSVPSGWVSTLRFSYKRDNPVKFWIFLMYLILFKKKLFRYSYVFNYLYFLHFHPWISYTPTMVLCPQKYLSCFFKFIFPFINHPLKKRRKKRKKSILNMSLIHT